MPISRRQLVKTFALASLAPAGLRARVPEVGVHQIGALESDPRGILDLPPEFAYTVVSTAGDEMDDGLLVPGRADGMAAFAADDGKVLLVCNHENLPGPNGPFGRANERLSELARDRIYDAGGRITPGCGGTTTLLYDPNERKTLRRHLSLAGTEVNCAGGPTPWGSWLSCEENFSSPGVTKTRRGDLHRDAPHGYVFEVPADADEAVHPIPLRAMGRFEHEATAVDPVSGAVFLTEDRHESLLYRFEPKVREDLKAGGQLQALSVDGMPAFDTRNWLRPTLPRGEWLPVTWLDLDDVDTDDDDLRFRGHKRGAAVFARGEGLSLSDGSAFFTATIGGPSRLGQIFELKLGRDGREDQLRLLSEADAGSLLHHADNLTVSPWGDLVVCEDTLANCGLVGVRGDGEQYALANNPYTTSELAGVCFSPDGNTLFVNIQDRGLTLAIHGPWPKA